MIFSWEEWIGAILFVGTVGRPVFLGVVNKNTRGPLSRQWFWGNGCEIPCVRPQPPVAAHPWVMSQLNRTRSVSGCTDP